MDATPDPYEDLRIFLTRIILGLVCMVLFVLLLVAAMLAVEWFHTATFEWFQFFSGEWVSISL